MAVRRPERLLHLTPSPCRPPHGRVQPQDEVANQPEPVRTIYWIVRHEALVYFILSDVTARNRPKSLGPVVLASVATAVALVAGQYGLLLHDVGVFWVLIRVLVCGGIGAFGWAAWTDQLKNARGKSVEVS
jgi:hypothetical protein